MSSGVCGIWAMKAGDFKSTEFDGSAAGLAAAIAYCETVSPANGIITVYPGNSTITIPALPAGVLLVKQEGGRELVYGIGGELQQSVNVREFASFQAAHDALPSGGGVIVVPPHGALGNYTQNTTPAFAGSGSTPALTITKPIVLLGAGRHVSSLRDFGTGAENRDSIFVNTVGGVEIRGLTITGHGSAGTGNLINWYKAATNMTGLVLADLELIDAPAWAVSSVAAAGFYTARLRMNNVMFDGAKGGGGSGSGDLLIGNATDQSDNFAFERCEFYGPAFGTYGTDTMTKGCVHLNGVTNAVFDHCSCQSADTSTFVSFERATTSIVFRDLYVERAYTGSAPVWAFTNDGNSLNLLIGGMICTTQPAQTTVGCRLIKSGAAANVHRARLENSFLLANLDNPTDDIVLAKTTDFIHVENSSQQDMGSGAYADVSVTGPTLPSIDSATTIRLNRGSGDTFLVGGVTTITSIVASWAGRRVTLLFSGTAATNGIVDGSNLKLSSTGMIYTPDDTITLVCDGTNWYEVSRSVN